MNAATIGKWIIFLGLIFVVIGFIVWIASKIGIPFGNLPGDIQIKKEKFRIYFPIATFLILSFIFTLILNLIIWFFKK